LAVLDIVPTCDVWSGVNAEKSMKMWHMTFLAQPELPERLIAADPDLFLRWILENHAPTGFQFDPAATGDCLACGRDPATIHGMCEDFRSAWWVDRALDEADRGVRKIAAPLLVLWGDRGAIATLQPLETWRAWADDVRGEPLPGGHFIPEEASSGVIAAFLPFFDQ
jgi:haloacetate dehalogenase